MTFSKPFLKSISTSSNSRPAKPNIQIKNPLDKITYINQLQIFPSTNFGEKAILQIFVNGVSLFDNSDDTDFFSNFKMFDLPIVENQIDRSADIKIFSWNGVDATLIEATILIFVSEINSPKIVGSIPIQSTEVDTSLLATEATLIKNTQDIGTEATGEGTKTTADGGSGIVSTIYTVPTGKIALVKEVITRAKVGGSATQIRLLIRGQRIKTWKEDTGNPNDYVTSTGTADHAKMVGFSIDARKIWSDGSYPEFNLGYEDLQGEELAAGETIAYDGNFSSNFNATIDYAYTILERDA